MKLEYTRKHTYILHIDDAEYERFVEKYRDGKGENCCEELLAYKLKSHLLDNPRTKIHNSEFFIY